METANTMKDLFAAYAAIWIILVIYLFLIRATEKELHDDLRNLRQLIEHQAGAGNRRSPLAPVRTL